MICRIWKEKRPPLKAKRGTVLFCCIRMYGTFADAEFLRGGADRGPVLYDVKSQAFRPLLHVFFQSTFTPRLLLLHPMRWKEGLCRKKKTPALGVFFM